MKSEILKQIGANEDFNQKVVSLIERWQCEKEYENWSEYEQVLTQGFNETFKDIKSVKLYKIGKEKFEFYFTLGYFNFRLKFRVTKKYITTTIKELPAKSLKTISKDLSDEQFSEDDVK